MVQIDENQGGDGTLFDVIIVGRGPVGLYLACELLLRGLSVLMVERRTRQALSEVAETRACVVHGRTLEILHNRGLLDAFKESSTRIPWWHYGVLDTRLDFTAFADETEQNCTLFTPQVKTEEVLTKRAEQLGADIRYGIRIDALEQDESTVTVHGDMGSTSASDITPRRFTAKGKFLVGADGWRSSIRDLAGFDLRHSEGSDTLLSVEANVGSKVPNPNIVKNEAGLIIYVQLHVPSARSRIVVWTPSRAKLPISQKPSLQDVNDALEEVSGIDFKLSNPRMLTRFSNESGCVTAYRKGRIFLGGDAGHRHLPAGGQGMNLGIQEINNLGWKLAAVIRGEAPDSLLDTYESERISIARRVVRNTTSQSALFFASTEPELALREAMNKILKVPEANRTLAHEIAGFEYTYPTPLDMIRPQGWENLPEELLGKRATDVKLRIDSGEEKYLHDYLREAKWVQLQLPGSNVRASTKPAFEGQTELVRVAEILPVNDRMFRCGLSEVLIRPDGHLAFGKS